MSDNDDRIHSLDGDEDFNIEEDILDSDEILTDISRSTATFSNSNNWYNMPGPGELSDGLVPLDQVVQQQQPQPQQQYNASRAQLQQAAAAAAAAAAVTSSCSMEQRTMSSTRAMEDPLSIEPIPLRKQQHPEDVSRSAMMHQNFHPNNYAITALDQYSTSGGLLPNPQAEFLRLQQELANQQQITESMQQQHQQLQKQLQQQQQQQAFNQFATLTASQHMTMQLPFPAAAANFNMKPHMIQGPWGYAQINPTPMVTPNWDTMQAMHSQQTMLQAQHTSMQQHQALQLTGNPIHPGNAPTSMIHSLTTATSATRITNPENFMVVNHQELLSMESSLPNSPQLEPQVSSSSAMIMAGNTAAAANQAHPDSSPASQEQDPQDIQLVAATSANAKTKDAKAMVRPNVKDVCFALINHPGTKAWREKVDTLSAHIDLEWSDRVHQAVKSQLESQGRRFLVCVKASTTQSKGVKNKEWRLATDEEIMLKTKQRFRDWRKTPKSDVKKPRGRPSNKNKHDSQAAALMRRYNSANVEVRTAFFQAIQQCQETMEMARSSEDPSMMERSRQAQEKLELLLPMNSLRWSHVLENEMLQRQSATQASGEQDVLVLLTDRAKQHERIKKMKKAEIQVVNFIQCLMENGSNEINAALDSVQDHSNGSDDDHGDDDDNEDDEDDDDDEDDQGPDESNGRSRQASLDLKPHPRKRGRGPGASEADPDFYQYDMLTVFQATPLAFTLTTGQTRPLPPLDIEFEKKALADALRDASNVGVQVDVEFEVATTDRLSAFLAKGECNVMHLSCHGHPEYLALDNGWGGMQIIRVHELEPLIRFGAGNLQLVFLSSCCSLPAGEAFVSAGVPHVICCHHDQKPRDKVAIDFARNLYRSLACGKTLKIAFNLARQSINISPQGSPSEAEKFVLLPVKPDDDPYHDVTVFSERYRTLSGLNIPNVAVTRSFPSLPGNVKMNSLDVYNVLQLLSRVDVVKVVGNSGGRRLAAAVVSYVRPRSHTMNLEDIFWFPPVVESDYASTSFRRLCDILMGQSRIPTDELMCEGSKYFSHFNEAMSYFAGKRCLFAINSKQFKSGVQITRLERFVCDLLDELYMKIILVCGDSDARYGRLAKHCQLVETYTPLRYDPETHYEDAKADQRRSRGSQDGVVGDNDSLSDLSEASMPFEIHVGMDKANDGVLQPSLSISFEPQTAMQTISEPLENVGPPKVDRPKRSQEVASLQLESLLGGVTLEKNPSEKQKPGKWRKKGAPRRRRGNRDDDSSCTSASSVESRGGEEIPPAKTLEAYDATMSTTMAEQTLAQISKQGKSRIGIKGDAHLLTKRSSVRALTLDTAGKAQLYGRDKQISFLRELYYKVSLPGAPSEVVGVHGRSGTGKSTLVKHLEEIVGLDRSGIFASGKFDQINAAARPYSAIVDAISRLCRKIADGSGLESAKQSIKQALGAEATVIAELIPAISQVTDEPMSDHGIVPTEYAFTRFKELFRSFMRAVSSPNQPVVLFLDDLQWADDASRALIESLASDTESKNILFVWAYRDDDSGSQATSLATSVSKTSPLHFSDVPVGAVDAECLNDMIADLLQLGRDEVKPLSDLLSRRTGGNIHFVIQFVHMLQQDGLLYFSEELDRWDWDIVLIETRTVVTENVADLLTAKIARQPGDVQSVLQLAACLGFFFDVQLLESVASSEGLLSENLPLAPLPYADPEEIEAGDLFFSSDFGHTKFLRLLQIARKENLIIQTQDPYRFKFAHDRVRQCVYEMIRNMDKREELHLRIGMLIWNQNKSKTMDEMSHFIAIDQLNRGSRHIKDEDTRSRLAQLNLESAGKAVKKSAYTLAAQFLEKGIALLNPRTMWQKQTYDLCLELHNKSAEMESTHGNFDASDDRVDTVLHRARTLDEKLRAFYVKLDSLGVRRRMDEAISLGLEVLRQIGEKISQHPSTFSIIVELTKTKRVLKGRKGHELLTLPIMTDDRRAAAMRLLNSIAFFAWHSDRNDVLTFVFLRMTRITLTHGLCKYSPFAFAAFGMVLGVLGDIQQAYDFGTLALQILERGRSTECTSSTLLVVFAFLEHLKKPLSLIGTNLLEAFRVGMESGQVHYACQCLSAVGGLNVVTGKPLRAVIADAQRQRRIFHEYNQAFADVLTAPWHQFALNMRGQAANVRILSGEALDETVFLNETVFTIAKVNVHFIRMILLYILGDFGAASVELDVLERRAGNNTEGTHFMSYFIILFSGLVSLAMAQKTRRRKYFISSRKYINDISKYTKGGGLNCTPMLMLMQAIQKTMERGRNMADVKSAFDTTIVACARSGFIYLEGIANERAGEYLLSWGEEPEAQTYLNRAWQLFSEWDADAKVEILEKKYEKKYATLRSRKEIPSSDPSPISQEVE